MCGLCVEEFLLEGFSQAKRARFMCVAHESFAERKCDFLAGEIDTTLQKKIPNKHKLQKLEPKLLFQLSFKDPFFVALFDRFTLICLLLTFGKRDVHLY